MSNSLGIHGEALARKYLGDNGYAILTTNFRRQGGEIDIIAQKEQLVVFVEVKTWVKYGAGDLDLVITRKKQQKIVKTSRHYLVEEGRQDSLIRYDLIFIAAATGKIEHWRNVFT